MKTVVDRAPEFAKEMRTHVIVPITDSRRIKEREINYPAHAVFNFVHSSPPARYITENFLDLALRQFDLLIILLISRLRTQIANLHPVPANHLNHVPRKH